MTAAQRGLAALVLACAVCAAAADGARAQLPLSADEEDSAPAQEDTSLPPEFSAVGRVSACPEKECRPSCTAFLIGPDLMATAAHCVKRGVWHEPARIRFHSFTRPAVRAVEYVHAGDYESAQRPGSLKKWAAAGGQDIAILRLEERPGDDLGWLPKGKVEWDELAGGGEFETAGIVSGQFFHLRRCRIHPEMARLWKARRGALRRAFEKGLFFHTCYLRGGFSGGPLLRRENGKLTWIGLTSGGSTMSEPGYHPIKDVTAAVVLLPGGGLPQRE